LFTVSGNSHPAVDHHRELAPDFSLEDGDAFDLDLIDYH
jgi:hypothetical protein